MTQLPEEKINGLIALMKRGVYEGERKAAESALKRICEKYGISLEDLLYKSDEKPQEFWLPYSNAFEKKVLLQVILRYAETEDIWTRRFERKRRLWFTTLPSKRLDTVAAWDVLRRVWKDEQKMLIKAFVNKHYLFGKNVKTAPEPRTPEEMAQLMRLAEMMNGMQDVTIHKQISAPKS